MGLWGRGSLWGGEALWRYGAGGLYGVMGQGVPMGLWGRGRYGAELWVPHLEAAGVDNGPRGVTDLLQNVPYGGKPHKPTAP